MALRNFPITASSFPAAGDAIPSSRYSRRRRRRRRRWYSKKRARSRFSRLPSPLSPSPLDESDVGRGGGGA